MLVWRAVEGCQLRGAETRRLAGGVGSPSESSAHESAGTSGHVWV